MSTLTAQELTNLRTLSHVSSLRVSIFQPEILLTATVNGSFSRGTRTVNYTTLLGDWTEVNPWHLIYIGNTPGARDVATMRVKSITSNQLEIDENGIPWANGMYITIFRFYAPHTIQNRPWYTGGQNWNQFKYYDLTYISSGDANKFPAPVCIAGPARVGEMDTDIVFNFDLTDSYAITPGATIVSYGLTVEPATNATVNFNTGTGVGTITITSPGEYWATAWCVDSNAKSSPTRFVPMRVHDNQDTGYYDFQLNTMRNSYGSGVSFSLEAFGPVTLSDFPDNTLVIVWSDTEKPADLLNIGNLIAVGYLRSDTSKDEVSTDGSHEVVFDCSSIDALLDNMAMNDLELRTEPNPNSWYQFSSWMYMGAAVHHYLWWHTNMLAVADVYDLADNQIPVFTVRWSMGSIRSAINEQANRRGVFAQLTCDWAGRMYLAEDTQMFNQTKRNALDTTFTIEEQDISGSVTLVRQPENSAYRCMLGGTQVESDGTKVPYNSIVPAYIETNPQRIMRQQGSGSIELVNMVVADQTDANEKCGRVLAEANRSIKEMRITLRGDYSGAFSVIPRMGFYNWGVDDATLKRNLNINNTRWLCRSVSLEPLDNGDLVTSVVLEPEVFGEDGVISRYPTTHPTQGDSTPDWSTPNATPAVMTFASMHYRDKDDPQWEEVNTEDFEHGTKDVWWQFINQSSNPADVVWWGCGDGYVNYYPHLRADPVQRTPINALDDWGDGITAIDLDFRQVLTDEWNQSRKYVTGRYLAPSTDYHSWLFFSDTEGKSWNKVNLYDAVQPTSIIPLWMAVNNNAFMITIWADGELKLLRYAALTMTYVDEFSLGTATFQNTVDRTFIAFPERVKDSDLNGEPVYVFGRMQDPAGLTGVQHIIKRESGVWSSFENTWAADHCGGLRVSTVTEGGVRKIFAYKQGI